MSFRKHYADLVSLKRSRSGYSGNITKVGGKLDELATQDLSSFTVRTIEKLITSVKNSETSYLFTLEDAQTLLEKEEGSDELLEEETLAVEQFKQVVSDVNHDAASLLSLKSIGKKLRNFTSDLRAVRDAFSTRPDADQAASLIPLEKTLAEIRKDWDDGDHVDDHPLKTQVDDGRTQLTQLTFEMARTRDTTPVSAHDRSISSTCSSEYPRRMESKLPNIEVPTFNGDIMKWATFWAAFQSAVGKKESLSDTTKLIYLRKAIKDPECQMLLTDPREDEDLYEVIVKELHARFDRTKEVHRNLVQQLIKLTSIKETRGEIRRLMSTVKSILSSIKRTGTYCLDTFVTSIIYALIPTRMKTLWEQHTKKVKQVTKVQDMIDHFSEHAETLPSIQFTQPTQERPESSEKKPTRRQEKRQDSSPSHRQRNNVHVTSTTAPPPYKWDCQLCPGEKHPLYVCTKWLGYSIVQRMNHVRAKDLCHNCLAIGHTTSTCRSTYRCRDCHQPHHTTIHQTTATPATQVNYASKAAAKMPDALMMTAQVQLTGSGGQTLSARALIDSGAGMSLVSNRVAQLLKLKLSKTDLQFSGVQGTPCKAAKHITNLSVSPVQVHAPTIRIAAAVVSTVTNDLPTQDLSAVSRLPHLTCIDLADPGFHTPGRIDILLGADVYHRLLLTQPPITGATTDPAAVSTIFGWAITGPVSSQTLHVQAAPSLTEPLSPADLYLDKQMVWFWESEQPDKTPEPFTSTEEQVQAHYNNTFSYCPSNQRYTVELPKNADVPALGDSRSQALSRYINNERSILRRKVWEPFQEVVKSYLELGHAELVPPQESLPPVHYYLPMHSVTKQSSTSTKL